MNIPVTISRILVGCLFVFSGLVKAIDPLGLAYKMQEFFEVWAGSGFLPLAMDWLHAQALWFSVMMVTLEVILGIALLLGYRTKIVSVLLLLLTLFFTFLTAYVLFSGKIRACGCFGDCIPLTPLQTFTKDIILLFLVMLILAGTRFVKPVFAGRVNGALVFLSLLGVLYLQWYVLKHLPIKDCLPFKPGNNILELRKTPKDATYDKYLYTFYYKKDNEEKDFEYGKQPDSTWIYQEAKLPKKRLLEKGNNKAALINDFILTTESGNDTTEAILSQPGEYYILFAKEFNRDEDTWYGDFIQFVSVTKRPVYLVTADRKAANEIFKKSGAVGLPIFTCDGIAIKTAARVNPTLYHMNGPVIKNKWSWNDAKNAIK